MSSASSYFGPQSYECWPLTVLANFLAWHPDWLAVGGNWQAGRRKIGSFAWWYHMLAAKTTFLAHPRPVSCLWLQLDVVMLTPGCCRIQTSSKTGILLSLFLTSLPARGSLWLPSSFFPLLGDSMRLCAKPQCKSSLRPEPSPKMPDIGTNAS